MGIRFNPSRRGLCAFIVGSRPVFLRISGVPNCCDFPRATCCGSSSFALCSQVNTLGETLVKQDVEARLLIESISDFAKSTEAVLKAISVVAARGYVSAAASIVQQRIQRLRNIDCCGRILREDFRPILHPRDSVHFLMAGGDLPVESNDGRCISLANHDAFVNECGFAAGRIWQG